MQFQDIRSYGVYDVLSQELRSGDSLCITFVGDEPGSFHDDPAVSGNACFYGGQADPAQGDCAVPSMTSALNRRLCPCSQFGMGHELVVQIELYAD